jgi:hypothetical protein
MAGFLGGRARWCIAVAAVLVVALAAAKPEGGTVKDQAKAKVKAKAKTKGDKPKSEATPPDELRKLNEEARKEVEAGVTSSGIKLPARPARAVAKPSLTPSGLDALVEAYLESAKVPLASPTSDVEFVRRVYLDLTGRLPTPEQTRAFVMTSSGEKRGKLIEYLLNSDEYARNWARYWRDVVKFRATTQNGNRVLYGELEEWLADQFASNRPWDEIARGIITATGRDDENGAVNVALAHGTQAVELAGEVSRIFMGVQIQCAQCHDHPSDSWKRQQFHEFAAYFAGLKSRQVEKGSGGQGRVFELLAQGKPRYTMPDKQDPQKQIFVAPKFFLDPKGETLPNGLTAAERLAMAASYVTGQDNPWFAKAFVNRVWYVLMGEGFYSPVDDMGPNREAKAPEVLDALASAFQQGGYDIRWLFRTILNSRAYQREVRSTFTAAGRTPFASVCPSRLRSDQILDSLAQVLNLPLGGEKTGDAPAGKKGAATTKALAKDLKGAAGKGKGAGRGGNAARTAFNDLFGVDPSTPNDEILGTIPQALYLMNSPQINRALGGVIGQILANNPGDNRAALGALYIRVLAREPTAQEVKICGRYLDNVGDRREAFEDIFWSLINSTEFVTRR